MKRSVRTRQVKYLIISVVCMCWCAIIIAQKEVVEISREKNENKINIFIGHKLFTSFLYPDSLEKPVLYPIFASNGTRITRGFPLHLYPGEPTDHPHHIGLWLTFENVNGLDFWNNSYAIPPEKKHLYGWIRTDHILQTSGGVKGILSYHANWTDQKHKVLLEETTRFEFSGTPHHRTIDRITSLKADTDILFTDAKDGMLGLRVARELQIPSATDQKFTDDKGNITIVKKIDDSLATGNYLTSEGKQGDDAWSTRAVWCKMYGKMGKDSISITIIDHPGNPNYPTFWHARGYGLFAANPLGEKIFTNGKSEKNLHLKKGESVQFYYRILIDDGKNTVTATQLNKMANEFARMDASRE
ncbi:MAG TPA: PmoA family protein [Chitinophagaceae bacterium]|nr:PmoA family protein [Chitinophagaceae bacterium]